MTEPNLGCSHKKVQISSALTVRWEGIAPKNFRELENAKICRSFTNTTFGEWTKNYFQFFAFLRT